MENYFIHSFYHRNVLHVVLVYVNDVEFPFDVRLFVLFPVQLWMSIDYDVRHFVPKTYDNDRETKTKNQVFVLNQKRKLTFFGRSLP